MKRIAVFQDRFDRRGELQERGLSLESLREEYFIGSLHDNQPFKGNDFVMCSDDSGTPCLTKDEFGVVMKTLRTNLSPENLRFLEKYITSRTRKYVSHRRGPCIALRSDSYYRNFHKSNGQDQLVSLKRDLEIDVKVYNLLTRTDVHIPVEIISLVVEHIKNIIFRIMYAYVMKGMRNPASFDLTIWSLLDNTARNLWSVLVSALLNDSYQMNTPISFRQILGIVNELNIKDLVKIRELDSAKVLLHVAHQFYTADLYFDNCLSLLYGGIEMPYAIYAYGLNRGKNSFGSIIPVVFSSNRLKKGLVPVDVLDDDGLIRMDKLDLIIPEALLKTCNFNDDSKSVILDNNITTGESISRITESFRANGHKCECVVAQINTQEIKGICEQQSAHIDRRVCVRGKDFVVKPVGEYVSCFGMNDSSQVVNRIKFILGRKSYAHVEGYDFDDTLFKTGQIHRRAWNHALTSLNIDVDVVDIPSNSGLSFRQAAMNIWLHLIEIGIQPRLSEADFVSSVIKTKIDYMLRVDDHDLIPIAKIVNQVKSDIANTKIIVTNNRLAFVLKCLEAFDLLQYFSYIIGEDYAYSVHADRRVALSEQSKPDTTAYLEATTFFGIPKMQRYYGDNEKIDALFAKRLRCNFVLVE